MCFNDALHKINQSIESPLSMLTISQVAKRAHVSTATVDRVINGRVGVSAATAERVRQAIAAGSPDQQPTRKIKKKKVLRFAFVLPEEQSAWVDQVEKVITRVASAERKRHSHLSIHKIPTKNPENVAQHIKSLSGYDGVALMAPDTPETKHSIAYLVNNGVSVLCVFSDVPGSARHLFVGADSRAAGRTAARLICNMATPQSGGKVLLLARPGRMASEIERRIGFVQLFEERQPLIELVVKADLDGDDKDVLEKIKKTVETDQTIGSVIGIYCASELLPILVSSLSQTPTATSGPTVVAHDATDINVEILRACKASYLLSQDVHQCISTATLALKKLKNNLRDALAIVQPRVEILTSENSH
jgi:LacI family transcriptional regulator